MTEQFKRYSGPATVKRSYMNEFIVECPKCEKEALLCYDDNGGKLLCLNCNYIERASEYIRYNVIIKRSCDSCGKGFEIIIPNNKDKVDKIDIPCPSCGITRTYNPKNEEYRIFYKNESVGDPIFNLPLWFQCNIRGNLFWGYNREHLNEIRNYVIAKLRERQTTTHYYG